jgi:RNA polymerase sigma-70 factor, ECF subfamily
MERDPARPGMPQEPIEPGGRDAPEGPAASSAKGVSRRAVEAVWRIESAQLIARLTRMVGDVGMAEDMAQDALVLALERWPRSGVPENPGAWLMTTARNRAIDQLRRRARLTRKHEELARELDARGQGDGPEIDAAIEEPPIEDDLLRLMFTVCHPVLSTQARVTLTLRLLGGLTTAAIARGLLASEATVAQRIVRAKRTLAEARVGFELPAADELAQRLGSVLEVIYLVFNEGYVASAGERWMRPELCAQALRLGRILAGLARAEPEVHGLLALMEIQASRLPARIGPSGEPVLLLDQDRARWDRLLAARGLAGLQRAERLSDPPGRGLGPYTLQAAIAACHARAAAAADTDWVRIVALYDALAQTAPSPVVELNRAVAVTMAFGPDAGLELVDALADEPALQRYAPLPTVRGDLLARLGRHEEARAELTRAAELTQNADERRMLLERAATCAWRAGSA